MTTHIIHGVENRIISLEAIAWARKTFLPQVAGSVWEQRFIDALAHMEQAPVRCERIGYQRYTVACMSASEPGVEHIASADECDCWGHRRHGYCWHRAVAMLLTQIDKFEMNEMRREFRVVYTGGAFALKYQGQVVADVLFDDFSDAAAAVRKTIMAAYAA